MNYSIQRLAAHLMVIEAYNAPEQDLLELNLPVEMGGQPSNINEYTERAEHIISAYLYLRGHSTNETSPEDLRTLVYSAGKASYGKARLRDYFRDFYLLLFGRTEGSQLNLIIEIWGVDAFMEHVDGLLLSM